MSNWPPTPPLSQHKHLLLTYDHQPEMKGLVYFLLFSVWGEKEKIYYFYHLWL